MKKRHIYRRLLSVAALAALVWVVNGCVSDETADNRSGQPWNSPQTWENGLPSEINEGR